MNGLERERINKTLHILLSKSVPNDYMQRDLGIATSFKYLLMVYHVLSLFWSLEIKQ